MENKKLFVTFTIVAYVFSETLDSWDCVTIECDNFVTMRQSLRMIRYTWENHSIRVTRCVDNKKDIIYEDKEFYTFSVCSALQKIFGK